MGFDRLDRKNFVKPNDEGHDVGNVETIKPLYTALFVDNSEQLFSLLPEGPKHPRVFAHHSTIAFKPGSLAGIELGKKQTIKILGRAFDEKGDALLVENPKSKNEHPHITLSCAEGVSPVYSNELLKQAVTEGTISSFEPPLEIDVTEGYFDGKRDVTEA